MVNDLPFSMRRPRKARASHDAIDAWFYVGQKSVEVFARVKSPTGLYGSMEGTARIVLTRKQLTRALQLMDSA